jgi:hypothetical protein
VLHLPRTLAHLQARSELGKRRRRPHKLRRRETPPGEGSAEASAAAAAAASTEQLKATLRAAHAAYRREYGGPARKPLRQRLLRQLGQRVHAHDDVDDAGADHQDLRTNAQGSVRAQRAGASAGASASAAAPFLAASSLPDGSTIAENVAAKAAEAEAAAAAADERARFDAIRKDALAWARYRRTGRLPPRAHSAGMHARARGPDGQ